MTRLLLLCSIFLLFTIPSFAQSSNGSLKGTVSTSDGKPAVFVTVKIENTKWTATTDESGVFGIDQIRPGNYVVKFSAIGTVSQEKQVEIKAGETVQIECILKESASQLQEVIVTARNLNKENKFVSKMPLRNLENPQVYTTVSAATLNQQGITNYDDALRNVAGIVRTWGSTGRADDGASYFALRGFDAQPNLINGLPGLASGTLDPVNVEEINVIKGPSSTLFGGTFYGYGGVINTVTKKPYHTFGAEVGYKVGSFGLHRVTADVNLPFSKKVAFRITSAFHSEKNWQDAGFKKSFYIAPSLSYDVNDRLSLQVMAEILEENRAVPPVFFHSDRTTPLVFKNIKELNLNTDLSFTSDDLTMRNPRYNVQAQALYKLGRGWTSQTVFSHSQSRAKGIYTYIWGNVGNKFGQSFDGQDYTRRSIDVQQNFNGEFTIGKMRNRVLIGLDYFHRNVRNRGIGSARLRNVTPQGEVTYEDPETGEAEPVVPLDKKAIYQILTQLNGAPANGNVSNSSYSAYVSDVVDILPRLSAMVSLRVDYFDSKGEKSKKEDDYDQTAFSPKFGLIYQAVPEKFSVFANYMNAFVNVEPRTVKDADQKNPRVKSFRPEQANQFEFGFKSNLLSNKLQVTLSAYNITVSDRVIGMMGNPFDYTQKGKVRSQGFELEATAYPVAGLSIIGGYSFNKIKTVDGDKNDFYSEPGRAPGGQGPQNLANIWANYKFTKGALKNLSVGAGGNYASVYKVIDNSATGVFELPSYALVNAGVSYSISNVRISFNVNNIFDKSYYSGYWSVNPQPPVNFVAGVSYSFK
ncbi:TonB-dependent receptor [Pseudoflavitalea sp. G-6-1-2]|uniref:TonB-dependent receptor n=1 Tax=Pseudoflavitalea sp. G-6-1-2 TaxID=2728841 RepID=UPI00146BC29C|nr:TonB-dependent receptor [Pseudoflavitalea sp. G-6-1-2]NML20707.1 TonB-dependent receptor [Pseudoflavitalea sp. G-6-1-2]